MLELTCDNAAEYLREHGFSPDAVTFLSGGVSNVVFRVDGARGPFILKQSRPQLRTRDAWFSDIRRIWREQEVMEALAPYLDEATVPRVLFVDRDNYTFAMSHAPAGAVVWKEQLLAGKIDDAVAARVGRVLACIHQSSAEHAGDFQRFADTTIYDELRIDPFYRRVQQRVPDVAAVIEPMVHDMLTRKESLCHGDYTPKNMLVHDAGFMLVDYETAHFGDPTMDLGLCLAHLFLKAARRPADSPALHAAIRALWREYAANVAFRPVGELERRGAAHLGVCLLARVDGTSPVDYLDEQAKDKVRRLARAILLDGVRRWEDVLNMSRT
ncbi:MAG: aminoglycoside phosphotransferase family protein [Gemmataceae bacterium]